jgi:hypothetical protein
MDMAVPLGVGVRRLAHVDDVRAEGEAEAVVGRLSG